MVGVDVGGTEALEGYGPGRDLQHKEQCNHFHWAGVHLRAQRRLRCHLSTEGRGGWLDHIFIKRPIVEPQCGWRTTGKLVFVVIERS